MAQKPNDRRGLGRGLSALMADIGLNDDLGSAKDTNTTEHESGILESPIEHVRPNPNQPRRYFDEEALAELSASIRDRGIMQPILVRRIENTDQPFEIVAGERRWRAAQIAQLKTVPVIVRRLDDQEVLEVAIIENIQREELNSIEEAQGYQQLIERFGHTQEKVAEALGKSRSHIANLLRLLRLPDGVQNMIVAGKLSAGHARALITAENPLALAEKVVGQGLSVRQTEALARQITAKKQDETQRNRDFKQKDADTRVLEEDLSANLGMAVVIEHNNDGQGRVKIQYKTLEQLDQLCQLLSSVR